jgi:hypothetical protein
MGEGGGGGGGGGEGGRGGGGGGRGEGGKQKQQNWEAANLVQRQDNLAAYLTPHSQLQMKTLAPSVPGSNKKGCSNATALHDTKKTRHRQQTKRVRTHSYK